MYHCNDYVVATRGGGPHVGTAAGEEDLRSWGQIVIVYKHSFSHASQFDEGSPPRDASFLRRHCARGALYLALFKLFVIEFSPWRLLVGETVSTVFCGSKDMAMSLILGSC